MKVIVSTDSIKYPLTGIGRYTYELINHLEGLGVCDEILFSRKFNIRSKYEYGDNSGNSKNNKIISFLKKQGLLVDIIGSIYPFVRGASLRGYEDYIYHGTGYYLPAMHQKCIATFHDISNFTCPQFHPDERVRYMNKQLVSSMRRATAIISVSEFTKSELIKHCDYPSDNIYVTPLACSPDYHPRSQDDVLPLLNKLKLNWQQFTLFIGSIEPRKNIASLLDAYESLPLKIRSHYPLVICGHHGWKSEHLHQRFVKAEQQGWLKYIGFIAQDELPLLYAAARTFVFPSHYEGFGLPVLEAMASGVPVVCSNAASLPEVTGDAALQSSPEDVEMLRFNIEKSLLDDSWRELAILRGLTRASYFSWERCARETFAVYQDVQK